MNSSSTFEAKVLNTVSVPYFLMTSLVRARGEVLLKKGVATNTPEGMIAYAGQR